MVFIIHGDIFATCTARVVAALFAMGLDAEKDFKIEKANFQLLKTPEWLAHQPFGQIPYLVDTETGLEVFESRAMIKYVAAKVKSPLAPTAAGDLTAYAKYEQGAQVEVTQWMGPTDRLAAQLLFGPMHGGTTDDDAVAKDKAALAGKLEGYERILSKQQYLGGDQLTLVDLAHLPYGAIASNFGVAPALKDGSLPNVARWWKELEAHPAWAKTKALGHPEFGKTAA